MPLFTATTRTDLRRYRQRETRYQYLDQSARPECAAIRRRLTRWLNHYPKLHQEEWISRFSSKDDIAYSSAFFELYLYTYLICSGFSVDVAPGSQGGTVRAPDFKVRKGRLTFYLEATTAHDESAAEKRVAGWKTLVRNHIDAIENDAFFVSLEWVRAPTTQPAPSRPVQAVRDWLLSLDYAALHGRRNDPHFNPPSMETDVMDGRLRVLAWPKGRIKRTDGLLGSELFGLRQVNVHSTVRGALRAKSSRYGNLGLPYVVAINVHAETADQDDFVEALYGTAEVVVHQDGRNQWRYGSDGGFGHFGNARAKRVSAALCVRDISPWTIGQEHNDRRMCVVHHPQCNYPFAHNILAMNECWVEGKRVLTSKGRYARSVLGIPKDWPNVRR